MRYYRAKLTKFFGRRCSDRVDDLVQETMLAGIRARDRIAEPHAYTRYVFVAARRILARDIEHRRRECPAACALDPNDATDPASAVLVHAQINEIREALERMPPAYGEALAHYYLYGRRGAELAHALGVPEGTARTRIRRGLARVRQELDRKHTRSQGSVSAGAAGPDRSRASSSGSAASSA